MTDFERDLMILAMIAFDEASDQGAAGIRAVCWSIVNRHAAGKWYSRKTIAGTCLLSWQYSSLNDGDPNRERGAETPLANAAYQICLEEAELALKSKSIDPTGGATHYYRAGTKEPAWVSGRDAKTGAQVALPAVFCCQVNDHLFFKNVA